MMFVAVKSPINRHITCIEVTISLAASILWLNLEISKHEVKVKRTFICFVTFNSVSTLVYGTAMLSPLTFFE